jgi:hypothetical protein
MTDLLYRVLWHATKFVAHRADHAEHYGFGGAAWLGR